MKALLELHYLQNFAPSNLNRDDTGSPKDAFFGGTRRLRVSSQSFKRAMRQDFKSRQILTFEELGHRSKRLLENGLVKRLTEGDRAIDATQARWASEAILLLQGIAFIEEKNEEGEYAISDTKSEALAFIGEENIQKIVDILKADEALVQRLAGVFSNYREKARNGRNYKGGIGESEAKRKLRGAVSAALGERRKEVEEALDGNRAVDIALFGRMLADLPDKNADAAAQVAHAISTHALRERQYDFYTAVDDLKPEDNAGADMLGTVEFASATLYRYVCIDLAGLLENLQGDRELLERGLQAFLYASVFAAPTGKQNTFAAHNLPGLLVQVVRRGASPRNLANAFENGSFKREEGEGYLLPSMNRLAAEMQWHNQIFGDAGQSRYISRHPSEKVTVFGQEMESVGALIEATVADAMSALGA